MSNIAEMIQAQPKTRTDQCEIHGQFQAKCFLGTIWSRCPSCAAQVAATQEDKQREDRRDAWTKKICDAGIPERFWNRSLQSYIVETEQQAKALKFAKDYADNFSEVLRTGRSAAFVGRPGTGKTHLAVGIGMRIMQRDARSVLFTSVLRIMRRIKDSWSRLNGESESQALAALVYPDLLIIDEVGQQFGSSAEKLILFEVMNTRYEKRKPTLLLANVPLDDYADDGRINPGLKSFLGDRIMDRLREDGGEFVVFDWESNRGKAEAIPHPRLLNDALVGEV